MQVVFSNYVRLPFLFFSIINDVCLSTYLNASYIQKVKERYEGYEVLKDNGQDLKNFFR